MLLPATALLTPDDMKRHCRNRDKLQIAAEYIMSSHLSFTIFILLDNSAQQPLTALSRMGVWFSFSVRAPYYAYKHTYSSIRDSTSTESCRQH
jgi:hypothetical protein